MEERKAPQMSPRLMFAAIGRNKAQRTFVDDTVDTSPHANPLARVPMLSELQLQPPLWPPAGWPMLACITQANGTATKPDMLGLRARILSYDITHPADGLFSIELLSGTMDVKGAVTLKPAMGLTLRAHDDWFDSPLHEAVKHLHIFGQHIIADRDTAMRATLALTYLIARIDQGLVPNVQRVLKIYKL